MHERCIFDVISSLNRKFFQIWSSETGYGEFCVCFQPIRIGEIFWMNNNDMIIVYLAGFMRLIRGSLCTWYTIFSSRSRAYIIVFMVTFCDDSFLIVFIQTEEDPLLYTVKKKLFWRIVSICITYVVHVLSSSIVSLIIKCFFMLFQFRRC